MDFFLKKLPKVKMLKVYALVKNMHYIAEQCNAYFQREYAFGRSRGRSPLTLAVRPLKICITMLRIVMHVFDEAYF